MPRKIIRVEEITLAQAKKAIEEVKQEELGEFQRRTLDYLSKFTKITPDKAKKLVQELVEKFKLENKEATQLVNCMPKSVEEMRTILAVRGKIFLAEQLESILKVMDKYREK